MKNLNYLLIKHYKNYIFSLLLLLLTLGLGQDGYAQLKAFPSAYGAGAYTSGGRGGIVVHVTNLNDSGKGSLREALLMTVPRTIVFDVSGVITLSSYVQMRAENSNVTIAGQTAPEGGITIDGNRLYLTHVDNIIVRHIRFRGGITAKGLGHNKNDSFSSLGNITNQIFDHCSFSWDGDESASWYSHLTIDKVTVQRSIFGEGEKGSLFGGNENAKMGEMSLHHSLFYNVTHRTPNVSGWNGAKIETINNVVWTVSHRLSRSSGNLKWNNIGNYYDYGYKEINNGVLNMQTSIDKSPPQIYTNGNKFIAINHNTSRGYTPVSELNSDNRKAHKYFLNSQGNTVGQQLKSNYFTNTQHPLLGSPIPIQSAEEAFLSVQNDVGCNARLNADGSISDNKDVLDTKWLSNVKNGRYVERSQSSNWKVPNIKSVKRPNDFYKSNPHIPEAFYNAYVPKGKHHNDIAPSGYTWLEEYLNRVDYIDKPTIQQTVEVLPESAELKLTETLQLTKRFKPTNSANQKGQWKSSDEEIAIVDSDGLVTPVAPGNVTIVFESTIKGVEGKSEITIMPNSLIVSAGRDQEICDGESVTLVASGGSTYVWSTGSTSKSITVSPNEDTVYTVTGYDSSGKVSDSDNVTVKVNALPKVDAGRNITINSGEKVVLKATGAKNYFWSTGEMDDTITVSPTSTTTFTVTGSSYGCEVSDTVKVIVLNDGSFNDKISAGENQSICKRSTTTLTATGGASYLWSTGESTSSIDVRPLETTNYSVTVFDSLGNELGSDEVRVTVNDIPYVSAGKNVTINPGESTTLTATGADNYLWSNGATTASITVSPDVTSYYSVIGTTADGCQASNRVLVMLRNTTYYVDVQNGVVSTISNKQSSGSNSKYSVKSTVDAPAVQSSDTVMFRGGGGGTALVKTSLIDDSVFLQNNSNTREVYNTESKPDLVSIEDSIDFEFLIYPNPTKDRVNIKINGLSYQSTIYLYDLSGKILYSETIDFVNKNNYTKSIDLSDYSSGVYLLRLVDDQKIETKKIVLQK